MMNYQEPVVKIVMFNTNDVITSSLNDTVGVGRSDWTGWSVVNDGGVWEE